ncbi:MAG: hypothetical protein KY442_13735, partial [Proteobacteria bacterium]|nr:hypothetical protein [Pseudomonadota bacterium]
MLARDPVIAADAHVADAHAADVELAVAELLDDAEPVRVGEHAEQVAAVGADDDQRAVLGGALAAAEEDDGEQQQAADDQAAGGGERQQLAERCAARARVLVEPLLDGGALLLLDVAALAGKYGRQPKRSAFELLEAGFYYAA